MSTRIIRDRVLRYLKNDTCFEHMVTSEEINGTHFSAVDLAIMESKDKVQVYRLMLVKHGD